MNTTNHPKVGAYGLMSDILLLLNLFPPVSAIAGVLPYTPTFVFVEMFFVGIPLACGAGGAEPLPYRV